MQLCYFIAQMFAVKGHKILADDASAVARIHCNVCKLWSLRTTFQININVLQL